MRLETLTYIGAKWQYIVESLEKKTDAQLVLMFGETDTIKATEHYHFMRERYPSAHILGCSSSGNIMGLELSDASIVATAVSFKHSTVKLNVVDFDEKEDVQRQSERLIQALDVHDLKHVLVISDGLSVNGSELVRGLNKACHVPITGGLAGDGDRFQETYVIADDTPKPHRIAALGFYGSKLTITSGCYGGWSVFGTQRIITKSNDNVVYEIDHEPALDLYKKYLGEYATDLPYSGLRFPLSIKKALDDEEIIRTLLAIDEKEKSITFAGDMPCGYYAKLMKPNIEVLIEGAKKAAAQSARRTNTSSALGLLVSCVGRKIVMGLEAEEEINAVGEELGSHVQLTGFYSYGEIAPFSNNRLSCKLHNQTMTVTVIYEN